MRKNTLAVTFMIALCCLLIIPQINTLASSETEPITNTKACMNAEVQITRPEKRELYILDTMMKYTRFNMPIIIGPITCKVNIDSGYEYAYWKFQGLGPTMTQTVDPPYDYTYLRTNLGSVRITVRMVNPNNTVDDEIVVFKLL